MKIEDALNEIARAGDGKINEVGLLPDGSGFATMSFPTPKNHWIYGKELGDEFDAPPMPFRMGTGDHSIFAVQRPDGPTPDIMTREDVAQKIRAAGRYAVRGATMKGADMDFDPDALIQNLVVGMLGYWTEDGLTNDEWANPPHLRKQK